MPTGVAILVVVFCIATRAMAGEIVSGTDALTCRDEVAEREDYALDAPESRRTGEGFRAGSYVVTCALCGIPVSIFGGASFTALDVDLMLRMVKGKVRFSGNMLPLISAVEAGCRDRAGGAKRREP